MVSVNTFGNEFYINCISNKGALSHFLQTLQVKRLAPKCLCSVDIDLNNLINSKLNWNLIC